MSENEKLENMELDDEAIENVAGGRYTTRMECTKCGAGTTWNGNYMNNQWYDCPNCSEKGTLHGVEGIEKKRDPDKGRDK